MRLMISRWCAGLLLFIGCTKPTIHNLPPSITVTPESRNLVGCRINGKPFSPKANDSASLGTCSYNQTYSTPAAYTFRLVADRHESACTFFSLRITLDSVELKEGRVFRLGTSGPSKNFASYYQLRSCNEASVEWHTEDDLYGEVVITKFDTSKRVVTGTFDFRLIDENGTVHRVSDGVFDRHFTK